MSNSCNTHLYVIMHPNYALVASQLEPTDFGRHYTTGSSRYYSGKVIFAEIDKNYRNDFFKIDELLKEVVPAADGSPKRTKFIATYRVLEHIDLSAFKDLYVTSVEGEVLALQQAPYERHHDSGYIRTFQGISPFRSLVLSYMTPPEFGEYVTDSDQPKGAPKVVFTQIDLDVADFLRHIEANPFHHSPLPNVHPQKLRDQILEIKGNPAKRTKGISLDSAIDDLSFLRLRNGFWIASNGFEGDIIYYPIPDAAELEQKHYAFYKSISG